VQARLIALHGADHGLGRASAATDAYLDAAGAPRIVNDVIAMAKHRARLVITAVYMKPVEVNLGAMLRTELSLTTAVAYPTEMPDVVAAFPRIKDKAAKLISHRYPFLDVVAALDVAGTPQSAKVMIGFD
jgi:(R,R)-butanediol dehydrogenase / meso-butanediol dehydrogenase / diacetyl reductase